MDWVRRLASEQSAWEQERRRGHPEKPSLKDDEELARALQQLEEEQESKRARTNSGTQDDERLARQLQDMLDAELGQPPSGQATSGLLPPPPRPQGLLDHWTARRGSPPPSHRGDGGLMANLSAICSSCHRPFGFSPRVTIDGGQTYHPYCLCCKVCNEPLASQATGQVAFQRHPILEDEFYCLHHSQSGQIKTCTSCRRLEPHNDSFADLADVRGVCLSCCTLGVTLDTAEVEPLFRQVLRFFEGTLKLQVDRRLHTVPVLAVDRATLQKQHHAVAGGEGALDGAHGSLGNLRGLTVSTVGRIQHYGPGSSRFDPFTGRIVQEERKIFTIEEHHQVTAILVLYGLPVDLTASIVAHEVMHAYIRLHHTFHKNLPLQVEEGLCQLVAFLYLQHLQEKASPNFRMQRSSLESDSLRHFFLSEISSDTSEVYGDGFRAAFAAYSALGFNELVDFIGEHGKFPIL